MRVHLTVDVEVWPMHARGWPHVPLQHTQYCERELSAYFYGECSTGRYGLPYQLEMLRQHGLKCTFFVDPMFSLALGLRPLRDLVSLIHGYGQRIELHLHPEWLTDPRCEAPVRFQGPMIGDYPEDDQQQLIALGLERLAQAGVDGITAFRAGSWGAATSTLRALERAGLRVDASLNARYSYSLADLPGRGDMQGPTILGDLVELPVTRFNDGYTAGGRPLSLVGVSFSEARHVLESLRRRDAGAAVIVLHSNEFVKIERLAATGTIAPRRTVVNRFARLCAYLASNAGHMPTHFVADHDSAAAQRLEPMRLVASGPHRTAARLLGQFTSRFL